MIALAGCVEAPADQDADADSGTDMGNDGLDEPRAHQEGANECSPYTEALVNRSHKLMRIVTNSDAFEQCVAERMALDYDDCGGQDPYSGSPRDLQILQAWNTLWTPNHTRYECPYAVDDGTSARAAYQGRGEHETKVIELNDDWAEWFPDWTWYNDLHPLDWRAAGLLHEFMHTHDYKHPNSGCPADYAGGVPYIYGGCVYDILNASADICGDFDTLETDELELISSWPPNWSCEPVSDLDHRFALQTHNGRFVSAIDGGGGAVDAHGMGQGEWETLFFVDINRGRLMSGDAVYIKTMDGSYFQANGGGLNGNASDTNSTRTRFRVYKDGGGEVGPDSTVRIRAYDNRWVVAENGGGGAVNANRNHAQSWERFVVRSPRRDHVVRLYAGAAGGYMERDTDGGMRVDDEWSDDADQAFWLLDQNGGELNDGDSISLESLRSSKFVSTCQNGTGQALGTAAYTSECSSFAIEKLGGSPGVRIQHDDPIALRSSNGRYLTGIPYSSYDFGLWNYSSYVGSWQRFFLIMAQGERWTDR